MSTALSMGGSRAIEVRDLHKYFGPNEVLKGIDFHVGNGQVVCVIGPSGSGKSTLLRCVNMLETPTSGKIFVEGDAAAGVQAFLEGKIQVDGDLATVVAMQTVEPSEQQMKLTRQISAITA